MKTNQVILMLSYLRMRTLILVLIICQCVFSQQYGDPNWEFDNSKYDNNYPEMKDFVKAGVQGGIPYRSSLIIKKTINSRENIQNAINEVASNGGGVVLLKNGTYKVYNTIRLQSKVVLRGESKNGVIIESHLRAPSNAKKNTIEMKGLQKSGIEDLTMKFIAPGIVPQDDLNNPTNRGCSKCWKNDPGEKKDLYVRFVFVDKNTQNSWIDNCRFIESGSDPLFIAGKHITCRNNFIDRSYNKGGGGNGYYDVRAIYSLFVNETVKRLRHFAIQQGAKYNAILNCDFEVDVNYHNKDKGFNLVENNTIESLRWRGWKAFATGRAQYGHTPPGPNNIIYNNTTNSKGVIGEYDGDKIIYTYKDYGEPSIRSNTSPNARTFYPVKRKNNSNPTQLIANATYFVSSATSSQRILSREREGYNAQMHNPEDYRDQKWVFTHLVNNIYTIKNSRTNRYLEVPYARCANNTNVATWTSAEGAHQKWKIVRNNNNNNYNLKPTHCLDLALDRAGGDINANVQIWRYSSTNNNQKWNIIAVNKSGEYETNFFKK